MIAALLTAALAAAPEVAADPAAADMRWSRVALPLVSLNVDEGVGVGTVAVVYRLVRSSRAIGFAGRPA